MYIQNHHIQKILNEYRKLLSQLTGSNTKKASNRSPVKDSAQLSESGQRQSIMDQVSADIIEQFSRTKSRTKEMATFYNPSRNSKIEKKSQQEMDFVYTTIDENDQKSTQIIPIACIRSSMASLATDEETRIAQENQPVSSDYIHKG